MRSNAITLYQNHIDDSSVGIRLEESSGNTITQNKMKRFSDLGISLDSGSNFNLVEKNHFQNCTVKQSIFEGPGSTGNVVHNNQVCNSKK